MTSIIKVAKPTIGDKEIINVIKVLKSGNFVQGKYVQELEESFAKYIGTKHAIATNSGTAAEHIALAALEIGPGDEVIVPSITFFSTATSVIHQNAIPIFADIEKDIINLDPEDFKKRITDRTRAVVPVHLCGYPAEMTPIIEYAKEDGIEVIEDAAQAHGAEYKGKKVGSIGRVGFWSLYATKNITTGEGGMLTTDDDEIARKARIIRNHGMVGHDDHVMLGYNYRMNEIQAAIGIAQLPKLDEWNKERARNSEYLLQNFKDIPWLTPFKERNYVKNAYFWCPVIVDEGKLGMTTNLLRKRLYDLGIETRHRYNVPLYRQPMLLEKNVRPKGWPFSCPYYGREVDYSKTYCANAERLAGKTIGFPNYPGLQKEELDKVIEVVHSIRASQH